jgi:hypothetical protein
MFLKLLQWQQHFESTSGDEIDNVSANNNRSHRELNLNKHSRGTFGACLVT